MLYLDGVYAVNTHGKTCFYRISAPTKTQLNELVHLISHRVAKFLQRKGLLISDGENEHLSLDGIDDDPMLQIHGHSITYRIAVGPYQGRKVFTLQTLAARQAQSKATNRVANVAGFSLHAGVMAEAHERDKLERLCRYTAPEIKGRSAVSEKGLAITGNGKILL